MIPDARLNQLPQSLFLIGILITQPTCLSDMIHQILSLSALSSEIEFFAVVFPRTTIPYACQSQLLTFADQYIVHGDVEGFKC
jgi:hypothetical protein